MSVYVIFHYNILNRERIDELGPRSFATLAFACSATV